MIELTASTLLRPDILDEPYDFYATLRTQAPVWAVPGTDIVTVATFDLISEAVGRPEDFSSNIMSLLYRDEDGLPARLDFGGAAPPTLATADPPLHMTHRKAVFPELVARRMLTMEGDIRALCATAIDGALHDDSFEFMNTVGNVVPITVVAKLIGFRDINPAQLLEAAFDSTAMIGGTMTLDRLTELVTRIGVIQEWIRLQVAETSDADDDGVLLAVRRALDAGTLQEGEVQIILHTLLSAGGETTSSLVGNAVRLLADDQGLQQRLREEPELIDTFVEEALRLESPFRQQMRSVHHDTALGGVDIPSGATVVLLFGSANRDPAQFDNPDIVDLTRGSPRRHLAFGHGIHYCVGAALARIEARAVLTTLLERTCEFAVDPADTPRWAESFLVRRHERLPLTAVRS
jgi:cytochrome P450 family 144